MKPNSSMQFTWLVCVPSILGLVLLTPRNAGAQTCATATISVSPRVVHYREVILEGERKRIEPNLTVSIELPDGSAGGIDPASITLNRFTLKELTGLERVVIGDSNQNGIVDLTVKANRSALITGDGVLTVAGKTLTGGCFSGQDTVEMRCAPGVKRSDYTIEFTTSDMPDESLNGRHAVLDVHRVRPVFPTGCPNLAPLRALVLVHGRTVPATAVFDLEYQDYSLMERLARRGIDTFAANHLGFGLSKIVDDDPLEQSCNASLPKCTVLPGATCSPVSGQCDCEGLPLGQNKLGQQLSTDYLNPNPLGGGQCAHTTNTRFARVTNQVSELDLVIDDARAKSGFEKVHLLGYSNGGVPVGKYLGDSAPHRDKIASVIFLDSSGFGGIAALEEQPPDKLPSWPFGLIRRKDVEANFNVTKSCPGQQAPGIVDAVWTTIRARDPIASGWGPLPDGLSRYPIVSRFLWSSGVASNIDLPALVIHGSNDDVVLPDRGFEIWSSSPLQEPKTTCSSDAQCAPGYACRSFPDKTCRLNNRVFEKIPCASHLLVWETCTGQDCIDPHKTVQKRVGDWILTGR
jgi:Lysophospholipase